MCCKGDIIQHSRSTGVAEEPAMVSSCGGEGVIVFGDCGGTVGRGEQEKDG